ncbi:MAG: RNA ligase family protein [Candidatus Aenigmatarchaeota archaeon]
MRKYPHIPYLSKMSESEKMRLFENAYIFEKIDGINCMIKKSGKYLSRGLRSGRLSKSMKKTNIAGVLEKIFWNNYQSLEKLEDGVYFFELLTNRENRKIDYKPEFLNKLFLLDVWDDGWLNYEEATKRIEGVPDVIILDVLHKGPVDENIVKHLLEKKSPYAIDGKGEGLVIKNYPAGLFAKIYTKRK